jgi:hypothetical protein
MTIRVEDSIPRSNIRLRLRILRTWTLTADEIWSRRKFLTDAESDPALRAAVLGMDEDDARPAIARSKRVCAAIDARLACVEALGEIAR